jgi:hypothetical protein
MFLPGQGLPPSWSDRVVCSKHTPSSRVESQAGGGFCSSARNSRASRKATGPAAVIR